MVSDGLGVFSLSINVTTRFLVALQCLFASQLFCIAVGLHLSAEQSWMIALSLLLIKFLTRLGETLSVRH